MVVETIVKGTEALLPAIWQPQQEIIEADDVIDAMSI